MKRRRYKGQMFRLFDRHNYIGKSNPRVENFDQALVVVDGLDELRDNKQRKLLLSYAVFLNW